MAGEGGGNPIRVYVRVRPAIDRESVASRRVVQVDTARRTVTLLTDPCKEFTFDGVAGEHTTQEEVFHLVGRPVAEACLNGFNGSIYVYGQTGAGKTYTMQGPISTSSVVAMTSDDRRGLMCRVIDMTFGDIARRRVESERIGDGASYLCRCSYLEIYRESVTDLLDPSQNNLQIREDIKRGVYVDHLTEQTVWSATDAFHVLRKGLHARHIAATQMNDHSSRSHAVFTLTIESKETRDGVTSTRTARLHLVDLAGSERQDAMAPAGSADTRVKEAGAINKSLSALTNVIMSLSRHSQRAPGSKRPFIHFRDSKLTFLLRDSLGGNSKTTIVANVSPSAMNFGETLSTCKFAARAKCIQCVAVRNEEYSGAVEALQTEVKALKQQLNLLGTRGLLPTVESTASLVADVEGGAPGAPVFLRSASRVRRLEILLGLALERARKSELRCTNLEQYAQTIEELLVKKDLHTAALRQYHTVLADTFAAAAAKEGSQSELARFASKYVSWRKALYDLPVEERVEISPSQLRLVQEVSPEMLPYLQRDSKPAEEGDPSASTGKLAQTRRRSPVCRGQRQPEMKKTPSTQSLPRDAREPSPTVERGPKPPPGEGSQDAKEEIHGLREENALLRQQLENHPELARLSYENRILRERLAALQEDGKPGSRAAGEERPTGDAVSGPGLTRTNRSTFQLPGAGELTLESKGAISGGSSKTTLTKALSRHTLSPQETIQGSRRSLAPQDLDATQMSSDSESVGESDDKTGLLPRMEPQIKQAKNSASTALMARYFEAFVAKEPEDSFSDESTLRVFCKKVCEELETLLKAGYKAPEKPVTLISDPSASFLMASLLSSPEKGDAPAWLDMPSSIVPPEPSPAKDPHLNSGLQEILQTTKQGLSVAQGLVQENQEVVFLSGATGEEFDEKDVFKEVSRKLTEDKRQRSSVNGPLQLLTRRPASSTTLPTRDRTTASGLLRAKSTVSLHSISEHTFETLQDAEGREAASFSKLETTVNEDTDFNPHDASDDLMVREIIRTARALASTLVEVEAASQQRLDQFQQLSEQYENTLDQCHFLEYQMWKLDLKCIQQDERLQAVDLDPSAPPRQMSYAELRRSVSLTSVGPPPRVRGEDDRSGPKRGSPGRERPVLVASSSLQLEKADQSSPKAQPAPKEIRTLGLELGQRTDALKHSTSCRSLHGDRRAPPALVQPPRATGFTLNKVASAPSLRVVDRAPQAGMPQAQQRPAAPPTFDPALFSTLANQPGRGTAALQYLIQSTSSVVSRDPPPAPTVRPRSGSNHSAAAPPSSAPSKPGPQTMSPRVEMPISNRGSLGSRLQTQQPRKSSDGVLKSPTGLTVQSQPVQRAPLSARPEYPAARTEFVPAGRGAAAPPSAAGRALSSVAQVTAKGARGVPVGTAPAATQRGTSPKVGPSLMMAKGSGPLRR
mmetsp:Transcript_47830/g.126693  ORF Transcript_47830/g.126693 Transcript_47830/m.126693 type:complete len:1430 (-) Transcript_47830:91-4380(-)